MVKWPVFFYYCKINKFFIFSFQFVQSANTALTVRLAANVLVRQYVIRIQLSVSVKPGVKGQLTDMVSTEQ